MNDTDNTDSDSGPELRVGQYGLRTFRVSEDGYLVPLNAGLSFSWRNGTCIAACSKGRKHPVPDDKCSCGIYSFPSVEQVRSQYPNGYNLLAVVSLEGRVIEGERGWRAEAARVVAIWMPNAVSRHSSDLGRITKQLKQNYPDVAFHENLDAMLGGYEGVYDENPGPQDDPRTIDKHVTGKVAQDVQYLSRAIRPIQLALLAVVTLVAARYAPTTSVPGYDWHTFLSNGMQGHDWGTYLANGMLALHQRELEIAAHPFWVTLLGGVGLAPMVPLQYQWRRRWRPALLAALVGVTRILSLETICVVLALTAHASVGWLALLTGVGYALGSVPSIVFAPIVAYRLQRGLLTKTGTSCRLVKPGLRLGLDKPPA